MKNITICLFGLLGLALAGCTPQSVQTTRDSVAAKPSNRVVVYYMHATLRCISCLVIENETRQTLKDGFSSELASGQVEYLSEDYWANRELADRYDIQSTPPVTVVVSVVAGGREVSHEKLSRVWDLKGDSAELRRYIARAVRTALEKVNARADG